MSLTAIQPTDLPTPREESWKYTDLPKAVRSLPDDLHRSAKEQEIIIHVKKNERRDAAEAVYFKGEANAYHADQLKIKVEQGAHVTVIERHDGEGQYWKNATTEIELGDNATLHHIRIQNDSISAVNTNMVHIKTGRDSVYNGFSLNIGGQLTRHEIHAEIKGQNAELSFNGINLLNGTQHGDTTILIEHQAPHCRSNQFYRTLLDDNARGVFQGKVHVHQEAQKTDGYQLANTLLLSPTAEMDTKPELEIYADDVKCSHGATTGQLDEEPLFYLRQRGLNEAQARLLLIQAFVDEVVDKVVDEEIRNEILEVTNAWLSKALQK